jgi:hypothetical protein
MNTEPKGRNEAPHTCEWCAVAAPIWSLTNLGAPFSYAVGPRARDRLAVLVGDEAAGWAFEVEGAGEINRRLRALVGDVLAAPDRDIAAKAAAWVVASWGGIHRGIVTVGDWSAQLGDYSDETVTDFIETHGGRRISSWSKLLAFAHPERHAVYDARTAVALNCALATLQDGRRFHMPRGRNRVVELARAKIGTDTSLLLRRGYDAYVVLLGCIARNTGAAGILDIEMSLFANAPEVALGFLQ